MFLKDLIISSNTKIIREINFRKGLNLIVDETPTGVKHESIETANSVGKTTVLQLVDFCLDASPKGIFIDPDSKKEENVLVKKFLQDKEVLITLILKENLEIDSSTEIKIERNFLAHKQIIRRINGADLTEDEFEVELSKLIFSNHKADKPTFRQIISHNIRYKDENINSTLRTLDRFSSDVEYETLHFFMLGIEFSKGGEKQGILTKLNQEGTYKNRLEKNQTKSAYETALSLIENEIAEISLKKSNLNLNENYEADLDKLNNLKYMINKVSSELSTLKMRQELIVEAETDLKAGISQIDLKQLETIYEQANQSIGPLQKTFNSLVEYHNQMINEKIKFISKELPTLEVTIANKSANLKKLLEEEAIQTSAIAKSDSFEELENLVTNLNEKYRKKGEYENIINQLNEVEGEIKTLNDKLSAIDEMIFTDDFELIVKTQLSKFNKHFSSVSNLLYGEQYALKYDKIVNRKGQKLYKFSAFNTNFSSGKKQGEISCFDIAYILFADEENIPSLHFLLNDKKELMHNNQLVKIAELVNKSNLQFVASILKDKLPEELNNDEFIIVKLSQQDKLFRIERNN